MGAGLAKAAYEAAADHDLEHAPTRLYVFMAITALDTDSRPAFFGGRDRLADAFGAHRAESGYRAVRRAVSSLTGKGLVNVTNTAPNRPARYSLLDGNGGALRPTLNGGQSASADPETADAHRPVNNSETADAQRRNGGRSAPERRTLSVGTADAHRPTEEKEEEEKKKKKKEQERGRPSPFCVNHPNGTERPCRGCGAARQAADAWRPPTPRSRDCAIDGHRLAVDGTCFAPGCEYRGGDA